MDPNSRKRKYPYTKEDENPTKKQRMVRNFCLDLYNVPPVPSINAFERGYQIESILDMVENPDKEQLLYVKFKNLPIPELVLLDVVLEKAPEMLTDFNKEYAQAWERLNKDRKEAS